MASNKRKPSKSMRQQRNRVQRQRAEARSEHAGEATAISRGEAEPVSSPSASTKRVADSAAASGADTAAAPNKKATREQKMSQRQQILAERYPIPGQRWVMMAFLFSIVTAGLLVITPLEFEDPYPVDAPEVTEAIETNDDGLVELQVPVGDPGTETSTAEPDGDGNVTIFVTPSDPRVIPDQFEEGEEEGTVLVPRDSRLFSEFDLPVALALIFLPIAITGFAFAATKHEKRSTIWTMCLIVYAGYIFLFASGIGILALPAMIALLVGNYQSRKAVSMARLAEIREKKAAEESGVIDVDAEEVDD